MNNVLVSPISVTVGCYEYGKSTQVVIALYLMVSMLIELGSAKQFDVILKLLALMAKKLYVVWGSAPLRVTRK